MTMQRRNGLNNGAISAFVADMGFSGVRIGAAGLPGRLQAQML